MVALRTFSLLLLSILFLATTPRAYCSEIEVIYAAKMPEISNEENSQGGLAELASLITDIKAKNSNTIFLHGGDSLAPSLMSSLDHGSHMIDVLNILEPSLMSVSEREFAYQEDTLILRAAEANFPFISSNCIDTLTGQPLENIEQFQCFAFGDHKICAISMLDPEVTTHYLVDRLKVQDSKARIIELSKKLKADESVTLILLTAHSIKGMREMIQNEIVDIVFHTDYMSTENNTENIGKGIYVKQGSEQGNVTKISIQTRPHGSTPAITIETLQLNNYRKDPIVQNKINYYNDKLSHFMNVEIGKTINPIEITRTLVRTRENAFGNLATDALRSYFNTDIAMINSGSIRSEKIFNANSPLTRKDIQSTIPFPDKGVVVTVSGEELYEALENSVSMVEKVKGRFLQVSGIKLVYCPQNSVGRRITSVTIGGKEIDKKQNYTLATNEYITSGGDDYKMIANAQKVTSKTESLTIWEIVKDYIVEKQVVAPKVEGRITAYIN